MGHSLRKSGIDIIGDVSWGTHIGHLYSSKSDFFKVAVPYIRTGLLNNELCIWIYGQGVCYEEVKAALISGVEDVNVYLENGQLQIIPYTEWYIKDNSFNEVRVNHQWKELIGDALEKGFDGLRAAADTSWLQRSYSRSFAHYEHNINATISELPFLVICQYDTGKVDTFEIAEIIRNHSYVITRHNGSLELIRNTELLIKDKQLENSKEKYKKLIQFLPDSVFIHDCKRIYYCNEAAMDMIGIKDQDEYLNKPLLDLVSPEEKAEFHQFVKKFLDGANDTNYLQSKFTGRNGEVKNVEIVTTKHYFQGHHALLSVVRDVTPFRKINELERDIKRERRLLNSALEYDKMRAEFFTNISHELRTPLNVILSVIQLLKLQSDHVCCDEGQNKYLKMMQQNCFRLLRLVNNLIDITKLDSDYFKITLQNYDIVGLLKGITMSVVEYGRDKDITIFFDANTEEKIVACDPDQIERIVLNLLSNAIKFTPRGGRIWVRVLDLGADIEIIIKDTGIGIQNDQLKDIFNRFQQVDKSLTRRCEGSGIGLSLVKALVEKHNGKITVNSEPGRGSEFKIRIPCKVLAKLEHGNFPQHDSGNRNLVERINIEFSDIYS